MSELTLVIGNKNYSSWSLRPWLYLKHHGVEFTEERIPLDTPEFKSAIAKYTSGGKVPVLIDAGFSVWDSLAIMEYLSENYTDDKGWPKSRKARAFARCISAEMHSSFASLRAELPMNCRKVFHDFPITLSAQQDIQRITHLWRQCRDEFAAAGPWLFGSFTIADAMFAPVVLRFIGYKVRIDASIQTYVDTVLNCDAIQAWIADAKAETEIVTQDER